MSGYLLDTNVVSELTKNVPHPQVMAFLAERQLQQAPVGYLS